MNPASDSPPVYCSESIVVLRASALADDGWEQRTISDETRVAELEKQYTELGFETTSTELDPASFGEACTTCAETACTTYRALFIRRARSR
ncbi:MAG: hypothetical protein GY708_29730 [Actinomycetia bacterium]|nr:hypothetical protein [Actinomycetes bacterium]MCP4957694.1 hypothetical protein [Actinomycetes bacterium]